MVKFAKFLSSGILAAVLLVALSGPVAALELLMIERAGCSWCQRWDEEIAPVYSRTDEGRRAPLYRANLYRLPPGVQFRSPVIYTPTFVLIDDAREVGRITGYADEQTFWGLLDELLQERIRRPR
jgi:hypothetical protein